MYHRFTNIFLKDGIRKGKHTEFPGGLVIKSVPCNSGDVGSIPGQKTKISQAIGQPRPHAAETEPSHSRARISQLERLRAAATKPARHNERVLVLHMTQLMPDAIHSSFKKRRNMVFKKRQVNHKVHMLLLNDWLKQVYLQQ